MASTLKSIPPSSTSLARPAEGLSRGTFDRLCARLEAAKNQSFKRETLETWFDEFQRAGWDDVKLVHRYQAVLQMAQVRRDITIDDWFHAPPAGDQEVMADARKIAERLIAQRRLKYIQSQGGAVSLEDLAREGFADLRELYASKFEAEKAEFIERMKTRCYNARTWISLASEDVVEELYRRLVSESKVRPIGELVERDGGLLRKYVLDLVPSSSAKDVWLRDIMRNYLKAEIVDVLEDIEALMQ